MGKTTRTMWQTAPEEIPTNDDKDDDDDDDYVVDVK